MSRVTMEISCKTFLQESAVFFLVLLVCVADDVNPGNDGHLPSQDPPAIVGRAMECFNNADTCKPEQRLSMSGSIDVPRDQTDEYCNGGCYEQTQVVLTCVDEILSNFEFDNKATIEDIRQTITEGCSNTDKRGDFDVTEHMDSTSHASKSLSANLSSLTIFVTLWGLLSMIFHITI